ncbi:MAG: hypothetical protein K5668_08350 [Lachnospiraceae bacterium]|nr:hypothetical protein [Lachnospiraceae bacterium]
MNYSASAGDIGGIRPSVSISTTSLSYEEQKAYGRDFNNANATLQGNIVRNFTDGTLASSNTAVSNYNKSGADAPAGTTTENNVYLKINDKYYLRNKVTDTYNINETWTDTITDNYSNAQYTYSGGFANVTINNATQTFDYSKVTQNSRAKSSTRVHTYYEQVNSTDTGYTADELDSLFPGGWIKEDTDQSSDNTSINSDNTNQISVTYNSPASQTITIPSAISGNPGFKITVTDTANSIGNSTIGINFKANGFAYANFSANERGYDAGNKNDHIEMRKKQVNVPPKELPIQATAANPDYIPLRWNGLNNAIIGIKGTNTKTIQDARYAIDEIADAIKIVSDTRSTFGAQQNRLEHSIRLNNNTMENTQTAESVIRDTDMAEEMVKYSKESILQQAGQAMLSQASKQPEFILKLLQ